MAETIHKFYYANNIWLVFLSWYSKFEALSDTRMGKGRNSPAFFCPSPAKFCPGPARPADFCRGLVLRNTAGPSRDWTGFLSQNVGICVPRNFSTGTVPKNFVPVPTFEALSPSSGPNFGNLRYRDPDIVPAKTPPVKTLNHCPFRCRRQVLLC